jgi:hypothetical protein
VKRNPASAEGNCGTCGETLGDFPSRVARRDKLLVLSPFKTKTGIAIGNPCFSFGGG